jgi:hypothetical protein
VQISWVAPNDQGSEILKYKIYIQKNDLSFTEDLTYCNGADQTVIDATSCLIPISELISSLYNLPWGSEIKAKLIARNAYGDSEESDVGGSAVILTNPDKPLNVVEVYSERTATSLGVSWDEGSQNGGSPVIDYTVSYAEGVDGTFSVLQSGVLDTTFTAVSLSPGVTYLFKV